MLAAGGGGGAGYGNAGGAAAPAAKTSMAAGTYSTGANGDGILQSPPSGLGGQGGSATAGAGGAATPGYGAGDGSAASGSVGGDAFVDGGGNVGAGGGGGGALGGGGGGGGGFASGGGAGSSYSRTAYTIESAGATAPHIRIETVLAPTFKSAASASFAQHTKSSFTVCAPSLDDPAITVVGTLPPGVTLVDNGNGTATISGTPTGSTGSFPITITSTGDAGTATQAFTLTITPALAETGTDPTSDELLAIALLLGGAVLLTFRRVRRLLSEGAWASA
jgi:hypothetical protein